MHSGKVEWLLANVLACALATALCPVAAQAEVLSYTFEGTVESLSDSAGIFGSPATGTAFTLTYVADFSLGYRGGGGGGFGGGNWLRGGTSFEADPYSPSLLMSPVSAVLQINGHQLDFSGAYYGNVAYFYDALNEPYGGNGRSFATFAADAQLGNGGLLSQIDSRLDSPDSAHTFYGSIDTPWSLPVDGLALVGATSFSYVWAAGTAAQTTISGTLTPTLYTVAAIPEPATWLLLAFGLAGVWAFRSRTA